jgi:hypothetical protein
MKVYVRGYGPMPIERREDTAWQFALVEDIWVEYSAAPEWRIPQGRADTECDILRGLHVHVGHHYCDFSVEELAESEFAIKCELHPELRDPEAASSTA